MSTLFTVPVQPPGIRYTDTKAEHEEKTLDEPRLEVKGREIRGIRWLAICVALYASCFLYGLDTTIVADVQGSVMLNNWCGLEQGRRPSHYLSEPVLIDWNPLWLVCDHGYRQWPGYVNWLFNRLPYNESRECSGGSKPAERLAA
jgi:hypothetical protein